MAVQQPETIEVAAVEVRRTSSSLVRVVFGDQRVVTVGLTEQDYVLALGVVRAR
jgi:hypothetical protein